MNTVTFFINIKIKHWINIQFEIMFTFSFYLNQQKMNENCQADVKLKHNGANNNTYWFRQKQWKFRGGLFQGLQTHRKWSAHSTQAYHLSAAGCECDRSHPFRHHKTPHPRPGRYVTRNLTSSFSLSSIFFILSNYKASVHIIWLVVYELHDTGIQNLWKLKNIWLLCQMHKPAKDGLLFSKLLASFRVFFFFFLSS